MPVSRVKVSAIFLLAPSTVSGPGTHHTTGAVFPPADAAGLTEVLEPAELAVVLVLTVDPADSVVLVGVADEVAVEDVLVVEVEVDDELPQAATAARAVAVTAATSVILRERPLMNATLPVSMQCV